MTDLLALAQELQTRSAWQQTPEALELSDFVDLITQAVRYLYVATGRAASFSNALFSIKENAAASFAIELPADELEYVLVTAEINFYRRVQTDVNRIVGYSTDALSITNADKPYANLSQTIMELTNKQRVLYYKMARFSLL